MISRTRSSFFVCSIVVLGAFILIAQDQNRSAVGTWKLDTQKSDFGGMPAPKDLTVVVTEDSKTKVSWKANGIDAQGKKVSESYSGGFDGKASPVKGSEMGESIAYTRSPDGTTTATSTDKSGKQTAQGTITMSDDGKSMTIKTTRKGPNGEVSYTEVFNKMK